ncbi:hypothetical protein QYM36_000070 [Artemia franciscana]|uniref:DUF4371 domain-containing protein n=1 Tax=Artemia franciscana TaxID=6661 RepID=A0AA88I795_ARTSF|nr:hypothetical protein QYM36_000070 [Artemia franciscana]
MHDASSAGQKNLIMKCLSDLGIPIQNLMGIGFDNASVNTGSVKGLGVLLKQEVPNLFILGCTSHSLALCTTYAAKKLPEGLEVFNHDIVNYIASSPKRQEELKKVKLTPPNFLKLEELKLGPSNLNYIATSSSAGELNRQQVQIIHTNCLSFLVEMCLHVSIRIDYKDETLVNLRCIDPTVAVSGKVDTIVPLMIRFPNLLGDSEGESDTLRDKLEVQWTKLAE